MKAYSLILTTFISVSLANAQNQVQLDGNNVNASLHDNGSFFNNQINSAAGYEIPKNSGNHTTYSMTFWLTAIESDSTLHAACGGNYIYTDLFPGPVSDNYNSTHYTNTYMSSIWKVTRDQINYHVNNFTATGYTPDPAIANWPGSGNTSEGIAAQLAPYVDTNNDQMYNPLDGDFPYIQGDMAVFVILNDEAGPHTVSGGNALGVEIHAMFYQYQSTDADINNTTFLNAQIFNRRDTNYVDFRFGLFMDTDIGGSMDDFIGSDSLRSLAYCYNGDSNDDGGGGQPGYGSNPPAFGVKLLNEQAGSATYFLSSGGYNGAPNNATQYFYHMRGIWNNGVPMSHNGVPYNFAFTGNPFLSAGWTELSDANPSGDRRFVFSTQSHNLNTGNSICFDYAFVFNQETGNHLENVNELFTTADNVQDFYNDNIQPCNQIFLDIPDNKPLTDVKIYPNPSGGNFRIQISDPVLVSIYSAAGDLIVNEFYLTESGDFNLNLSSGIYFLLIKSGDEMLTQKLIVH